MQGDEDKFMFYLPSAGAQNDTEIEDASSDYPSATITDFNYETPTTTCVDALDFISKNGTAYLSNCLFRRVPTNDNL